MNEAPFLWIVFNVIVLGVLILDLTVFHRKAHVVNFKEAIIWSGIWIALALSFALALYFISGKEPSLQFLAGYLIEKSLSIDNLFIFLLVFTHFQVNPMFQHKILFWGVLGALVMRAGFIFLGVELIMRFTWMTYAFGAFIIVTGFKLFRRQEGRTDLEQSRILRFLRNHLPLLEEVESSSFFIKKDGRWYGTRLLLVLLLIEATDLIFAVDSIPAILAISADPFIVYTSNVFALLGLRSLYFALAAFMKLFRFLRVGLAAILVFVGFKMLLKSTLEIPTWVSLAVVFGVLAASIIASMRIATKPLKKSENTQKAA